MAGAEQHPSADFPVLPLSQARCVFDRTVCMAGHTCLSNLPHATTAQHRSDHPTTGADARLQAKKGTSSPRVDSGPPSATTPGTRACCVCGTCMCKTEAPSAHVPVTSSERMNTSAQVHANLKAASSALGFATIAKPGLRNSLTSNFFFGLGAAYTRCTNPFFAFFLLVRSQFWSCPV